MAGEPSSPPPADVEVRRSRRRLRTVTAYRDGDRVVVLIPARFTRAQEHEWVQRMVARLSAQDRRRRPPDAELMARAQELSRRYLGGRAQPVSVSWVANQNSRWGSCTPADRTIRLSTRLQGMPGWVIDYVLVHELAHLLEQGHGARFWALVRAYPRTERARGYLDGFAAARDLRIGDDEADLEAGHGRPVTSAPGRPGAGTGAADDPTVLDGHPLDDDGPIDGDPIDDDPIDSDTIDADVTETDLDDTDDDDPDGPGPDHEGRDGSAPDDDRGGPDDDRGGPGPDGHDPDGSAGDGTLDLGLDLPDPPDRGRRRPR